MKNPVNFILLLWMVLLPTNVPSCERLIDSAIELSGENEKSGGLTSSEIVQGLKTALRVGTDSSVSATSRIDGFYRDEVIKILLPPEADIIYENKDKALVKALGIDRKIDEAILALNRAAEDAAKEAGPIFRDAITSMSISDGLTILKGRNPLDPSSNSGFDSTAATGYLDKSTRDKLREKFAPKVNESLGKKLVGEFSPNEIWNGLSIGYNEVAKRSFGIVEPMENTDLGAWVTEKALDGIFLKIAEEEKRIRKDPGQWAKTAVGNLLERVFGKQS